MSQIDEIHSKLTGGRTSGWDVARAFGVVTGPSAVLDAVIGRALGSAAHSLLRRRPPAAPAAGGTALTVLYVLGARRWMMRWGATDLEANEPLPGDELMPSCAAQSTRAVTIDAPVEEVWPWLAQIGQDRAGFYSYTWLENLAGCRMHNAEHIHPEWQQRQIGESVMLHPLYGLPVSKFEPRHALALKGWGTFITIPLGERRTRLLARGRTPPGPAVLFEALLIDIPHFVMERRMLLGIKQRAERLRRDDHAGWRSEAAESTPLPDRSASRAQISPAAAAADLYWIPLGAGGHSVRFNGRVYEAIKAAREHRPRNDLYHAALIVELDGERYAIEIAPSPDTEEANRGVVATGAVGSRYARRWRLFRYEVRCWRGGSIPDLKYAVDRPLRLATDPRTARRILDLLPSVPTPVWGRDELGTGEMWNSNSMISWLIAGAGISTSTLAPPPNGRAPGWNAGLEVARRARGSTASLTTAVTPVATSCLAA